MYYRSLEAEECPYCRASVKKENMRGHQERVHPKHAQSLLKTRTPAKRITFIRSHRRRNIAVLVSLIVIVSGIAGLVYAARESAHSGGSFHWHPQLSITINGGTQVVPAQIGIAPELWKSHELDGFSSMQAMPWMGMAGMAPLHTHDTTGTIHVESAVSRDYTLKEFLDVWGVSMDRNQVLGHSVDSRHRGYILVDGAEKSAPQDVVFADRQQIQIICGA